jgi:hypothetical protein
VEPLADSVVPVEGRAAIACPRIGVDAFELFEPASPRSEVCCDNAPQRVIGVGPDAADRTDVAEKHAASTQSALKEVLIVTILRDGGFVHSLHESASTAQWNSRPLQ